MLITKSEPFTKKAIEKPVNQKIVFESLASDLKTNSNIDKTSGIS